MVRDGKKMDLPNEWMTSYLHVNNMCIKHEILLLLFRGITTLEIILIAFTFT